MRVAGGQLIEVVAVAIVIMLPILGVSWVFKAGAQEANNDGAEGQRYPHQWGYADTTFQLTDDGAVLMTGSRYALSGYEMPGLIPLLENELGAGNTESRASHTSDTGCLRPTTRGLCLLYGRIFQ